MRLSLLVIKYLAGLFSFQKEKIMENKTDNAGVYLPPPLLFVGAFFLAIGLQYLVPLSRSFFFTTVAAILGWACLLISAALASMAILQFFKTKNTLITYKPATSLQTTGVYSISRNPIYTGFSIAYLGATFLLGNWWHFVLLPVLLLIVQEYVIKNEERYLGRKFGNVFTDYKQKVRRWL